MGGQESKRSRLCFPPESLQIEQFLRKGMVVALPRDRVGEEKTAADAKSFFIHPDSQDKALIPRQAPAVLKLPVVLMCFPQCLNRETVCTEMMSKTTPCPGYVCPQRV